MKKNIQSLLDSDIPTRELSRLTGVNVASISLMRNGSKKIDNIRYEVAEKMNDYVTKNTISKADRFIVNEFLETVERLSYAIDTLIAGRIGKEDVFYAMQMADEYRMLLRQLRYIDMNSRGLLGINRLFEEDENVRHLSRELEGILRSEYYSNEDNFFIKKDDSALSMKRDTVLEVSLYLKKVIKRYRVRED